MSTKEDKQQYLYAEIIDGGLDPEQFQQFLQIRRPEGLDINKWEFQQLKQIVHQFKTSKGLTTESTSTISKSDAQEPRKFGQRVVNIPKKQQISQTHGLSPDTPIHKVTELESPQKKGSKEANLKSENQKPALKVQTIQVTEVMVSEDKYQSVTSNNDEIFSKTIICQRTQPNQIFGKDIQVKIEKFQKMEGGFFEQGYIAYRVTTPSEMWVVNRRYSDFQWLRNQLDLKHPGYPIPPIAKKGTFRKFDEEYLQRRMLVLQNFLNKILTIPELKAEQILEDFLKIDDPIQYIKARKEKQLKEDKIKLENLSTLKGRLNLMIDPSITKYMKTVQNYMASTQPKLQKVYKDWKQISINLQQSADLLKGLNHTFDNLNEEVIEFTATTEEQSKKHATCIYKLLSNMARDWANILEQQAKNIHSQLYGVYKYEYINLATLSESVRKVQMARNQYLDYKFKIQRLKEKLYQDRNFSRMELPNNIFQKVSKNRESIPKSELFSMMLPKDMHQEQKLKQSYGLCNFQCYEQVQRYYNQNPKSLANVIQELGTKQSINTSMSMMLWADTITDSGSIKEGRTTQQFEI